MCEDEVFAVETFPTLGDGSITTEKECNHFMIEKDGEYDGLVKKIYDKRRTLAFCPRWFNFNIPNSKQIKRYPVLRATDVVAQYEKTIYVKDSGVEILN